MSKGKGLDWIIHLLKKIRRLLNQDDIESEKQARKAAREAEKKIKDLTKLTRKRIDPFIRDINRDFAKVERETKKKKFKYDKNIPFFDARSYLYKPEFRGELIKKINALNEVIRLERQSGKGISKQTLTARSKFINSLKKTNEELLRGIEEGKVIPLYKDRIIDLEYANYAKRKGTTVKTFIKSHGYDYQYGYAIHVLSNKKDYSQIDIKEATNYIFRWKLYGTPPPDEYYYKMKYGGTLAFKEHKKALETIDKYIEDTIPPFRKFFTPIREQILKGKQMKRWEFYMAIDSAKFEGTKGLINFFEKVAIEEANTIEGLNRLIKNEWERLKRENVNWNTTLRYSKYNGGDPATGIARGISRYSYEKLLVRIQNEPGLILNPTNLESLSESSRFHKKFVEYFGTLLNSKEDAEALHKDIISGKKIEGRKLSPSTVKQRVAQELEIKGLSAQPWNLTTYSTHSKSLTKDILKSLKVTNKKVSDNIEKNKKKLKSKGKKILKGKKRKILKGKKK